MEGRESDGVDDERGVGGGCGGGNDGDTAFDQSELRHSSLCKPLHHHPLAVSLHTLAVVCLVLLLERRGAEGEQSMVHLHQKLEGCERERNHIGIPVLLGVGVQSHEEEGDGGLFRVGDELLHVFVRQHRQGSVCDLGWGEGMGVEQGVRVGERVVGEEGGVRRRESDGEKYDKIDRNNGW